MPACFPFMTCTKLPLALPTLWPFFALLFSPPFKVEFKCLLVYLLWTTVTQIPYLSILSSNISLFTSFFHVAICLGGAIVYLSHFWTPQVWCLCVYAKSLQSGPTLSDPMDCSPPGSSVHGILQARILEWVAISFFRESSQLRDQTCVWQVLYN